MRANRIRSSIRGFASSALMAATTILVSPTTIASASGVWSPEAVFETVETPEPGQLNRYLAGELGVVRRDYDLLYLWAAQRALLARPLRANEIAVARLTQLRLNSEEDGFAYWRRLRAEYASATGAPAAPAIEVFGTLTDSEVDAGFLNCQDDAFVTAAKRLLEHRARPAADALWVRDWVLAQDAVFANCAIVGGVDPEPAADGAPQWLQADRAYQQAAALFYRGDTARAAAAFAAIASDAASPWRDVSSYLVARTWVREALYWATPGEARSAALDNAARAAAAGLADASLHTRQPLFGKLARRVALLRDPAEAFASAVRRLEAGDGSDDGFAQDLEEVRFLQDDVGETAALQSWLVNMRSDTPTEAYEVALAQWRKLGTRDWLLATLAHAPVQSSGTDQALAAVAALPASVPAQFPLQYERARLLVARRDPAAPQLLDGLLTKPDLSRSDRNALLRLRFASAPTAVESHAFATGAIVGIVYEDERDLWADWAAVPDPDAAVPAVVKPRAPNPENESANEGDDDWEAESFPALKELSSQAQLLPDPAAQLDLWLPARELFSMATAANVQLSTSVRQQLLGVAWLRAWLLGQDDLLDAATPDFVRSFGNDAALLTTGADALRAGAAPTAGTFRAAVTILRLPGLSPHVRPGVGRALPPRAIGLLALWRWWGAGNEEFPLDTTVDRPQFIDSNMAASARAERVGLSRIADSTTALGRVVMAYVQANPGDPLAAEALHLVVRATRYGTQNKEMSQRAYALLHKRYPGSEWAAKTRFHY